MVTKHLIQVLPVPKQSYFLFFSFSYFLHVSSIFWILSDNFIGGKKSEKHDHILEELLHFLIFFFPFQVEKREAGKQAEKESKREGERGGKMRPWERL